ncbi:glycine-rich domain-containing protein [Pseudomonas hefeiensis]
MDSITLSTGAGITWYAENGSVPDTLSTAFNGGVRALLDKFGLGSDAAKIPVISDFSEDIKPGLYRAFTLGHENASIGGPPETSVGSSTSMTVFVGGGYVAAGYKAFLAIINNTANGPTRAYLGHKTATGTQPFWSELGQTSHLPYRAKNYFKAPGVYQWTVPASVTKVHVEVVGGGGSGAFGGNEAINTGPGGGGGGGISSRLCTVVPGSLIAVTVGAGGAAVSTESDSGIAGGTSSFGSFCSATGGRGGVMNAGAQGGMGAGGDLNASLGLGFPPVRNSAGTGNWGGPGGGARVLLLLWIHRVLLGQVWGAVDA